MSRKPFSPPALIMLFSVLLFSCDKGNNLPSLSAKETRLTDNNWIASDWVISDSTQNDSSIFLTCMKDDILSFAANHDFNFSDGAALCDSSRLTYGEGLWAFNIDEDSLALKYNDTTRYFGVDILTKNLLQLSYKDSVDHTLVKIKLSFKATPK